MSNLSILFVPGAFGLPELYDPAVKAVAEKGYDIRTLHTPSVGLSAGEGREGEPPTMYDDAAFVAQEIEKLADQGKDVIVVAHSYGGVVMTESVKGLRKEDRQAQGKAGGVIRLAYMTALAPAIGSSTMEILATVPADQHLELKVNEQGWLYHDPISASAKIIFSDLAAEEGEEWIRKFPLHSAVSLAGELTYEGYKDIPVSYLVCEDDLTIPASVQREGIERIEKSSGRKVDVTSIKAGHCPTASATQAAIDWIEGVVQQHV